MDLGLSGFVGNDADGVFLEAQGPSRALAELERRIREEAPPLAVVDAVRVEVLDPVEDDADRAGARAPPGQPRRTHGAPTFRIVASGVGRGCHLDPPGHRRLRHVRGRDA